MTNSKLNLLESAHRALRQWDGVLTEDLVLEPGRFGLGMLPARRLPTATTTAVCGFCSTGCGLKIQLVEGEAVGVSPDPEYPVNLGMACPKGWEALAVTQADDRAVTPLLRQTAGHRTAISWDEAATIFCQRFKAILDRHGPESVAFLSTGQIPTEEMAILGAFAKFGMGLVHGDANTRQCMATAATAYKQSFGFDAPPFTYQDFEESDVLFLVGSNLCIAHPIMWQRILRNRRRPEIIVVDPRSTETARAGTIHLAIKPKSDLCLFYGLANILIREGWINREFIEAHTDGFENFASFVASFTPERTSHETGIPLETIEHLARLMHERPRVSFWWTMGINQSYEGVRAAQAMINLALMTGNIGRPGTGANSVTGQCNAMGSRLFSNTTNLFGGREFLKSEDRSRVAEILGIDASRIPASNSLPYDQIIEGIERGAIRGLWLVATNTAYTWVNKARTIETLKKLEFLVVQDMYHSTESAQLADLLLPAAGWGEKEGTFINSERRIGLLKKVVRAPGAALADFHIVRLLANYWGCGDLLKEWTSPEAAFQIMKRASAGQPFDFTGIADYRMIDECGGIQWPCVDSQKPPDPERRLFEDGSFYHGNGRARFLHDEPTSMPEGPCEQFPFLLLTGRGTSAQWHSGTRTEKSAVLRKLYPQEIYCEINPADAKRLHIKTEDSVVVRSRRGTLRAIAFVTSSVRSGQVFIPMHYSATNELTLPHFDPHSHQPSYKDCAVAIRRISSKERRS